MFIVSKLEGNHYYPLQGFKTWEGVQRFAADLNEKHKKGGYTLTWDDLDRRSIGGFHGALDFDSGDERPVINYFVHTIEISE